MSNSKNKTKSSNKQKTDRVSAVDQPVYVPSAPKRDGFSIVDFRSAIRQAESVDNPSRVKLLDYYNEILIDLHLTAVVDKRRDQVKAAKFKFVGDKGKLNEPIDNLMSSPFWSELLSDLLDARFYGFSVCWFDLSGGVLQKYELLPRKHIMTEKGIFLTKQNDRGGIEFINDPRYQNYIVTAGAKNDLGMLLKAIPWVLYKRGDISDQATFLEMFAMPFRKGKYPQYDLAAKKALASAVADAASMGYAIIPEGTELEFIQNQASGNAMAFERFAKFCDLQISKGFLHNTMTLDAEGGNYKGEVHESSESGVYAADRRYILNILNTQILRLLEIHGFNPGKGYFVVEEEDHICLKDRIAIDMQVAQHIVIKPEYWHEKYNLPEPEGGAMAKQPSITQQQLSVLSAKYDVLLSAQAARLRELEDNQPLNIDIPRRSFFD